MTGKEHAKLLGLFFWLLTGLQLLLVGVIGIFYIFFFGVMFSTMPHKANDPPPEVILPIIVVVVVAILFITVLMAIPKVIAGYGLRKEKSWAKVWAIVASVMACMNVPLGTAVGVYGLIFILGDNGKAYFDGPHYGGQLNDGVATAYTPAPNSWQQQ
ncbi:MAG: hypothetical protein ABI999_08505 [Acidobacteriota bacterium]